MQRLKVSGAVRPIYVSLGVKRLIWLGITTGHGLVQMLHRCLCINKRGIHAPVILHLEVKKRICGSNQRVTQDTYDMSTKSYTDAFSNKTRCHLWRHRDNKEYYFLSLIANIRQPTR